MKLQTENSATIAFQTLKLCNLSQISVQNDRLNQHFPHITFHIKSMGILLKTIQRVVRFCISNRLTGDANVLAYTTL